MDPILVKFGPVVIRWYGVMMALTIVASLQLAYYWGPRFGIPRAQFDRFALTLIIILFVGARLGYVVSHPAEFRDPLEIIRVWHGGLTSHGAIVAGLLYGYYVSRTERLGLWDIADTGAWAIPAGNVFVRWGNFMNGELYGDPTTLPWGVRFPTAPGPPRHPLQLYEIGFAVVIFAITWQIARRRAFSGQVWWVIVVLTSIGRIFLDALRSEDQVLWGIVTLGQVGAIVLILAGVTFLWLRPTVRTTPPPGS